MYQQRGLVASLANCIPMFGMMKDMDNRGKIINVAFSVSAKIRIWRPLRIYGRI